jgi:hypothetical protein
VTEALKLIRDYLVIIIRYKKVVLNGCSDLSANRARGCAGKR